jgi:peptidoglycan-N-acetylmuramic acid deacetylase
MRSLSPLSRRILKKAGIAAAFFCSAFLFGSVLSHFTCRALRKAAPVFLSAAPETPVSSVSMPVLSSAAENWGLSFPEKGKTPVGNATSEELAAYNAWFAASPEENIIYLTFDCGYENGNTEPILDALKKHDVKATFFVVGNFLETSPEIVKRMIAEGHTVGNHTYHHLDMSSISSMDAFKKETQDVENLFEQITGTPITKFYRPPQGKYNIENLKMAQELGYHTFFWSLAYVDWYQDKQPTKDEAFGKLLKRIHPGAIVLLHSTSSTNAQILDELLTKWEEMGYTIKPLTELAGAAT